MQGPHVTMPGSGDDRGDVVDEPVTAAQMGGDDAVAVFADLVRDPRRMFTRKEIWRAWVAQGRVCKLCRRRIPFDLMHGDHITAWSRGGRTAMDNLQALCGSCNLRKGSQAQDFVEQPFRAELLAPGSGALRAWQTQALAVTWKRIGREPVLIEACPGAGKTQFGLEVALQMVLRGEITRVLIVAPTLGIADGWQRSASMLDPLSPTLPLRSQRDWRAVDPIGDDWLGAIITYQSLFASTEMFLAHATDPGHRTLVIFDEVHHAGAGAAWGVAAQEAFASGAAAILALSGTPFRTAGDPIVFIPTRDGNALPHYRYPLRPGDPRQGVPAGPVRRGARHDHIPNRSWRGPHRGF